MTGFVKAHLSNNGSRLQILRWQLVQVPSEVLLDLALGFTQKSQADPVTHPGRGGSHHKCPDKPQRIKERRARAELVEPGAGPGQVVSLLMRCLAQQLAHGGVPRKQRLSFIERLGADLTHMIHTHQAARMPSRLRGKFGTVSLAIRRVRPRGRRLAGDRRHGPADGCQ